MVIFWAELQHVQHVQQKVLENVLPVLPAVVCGPS